MEDGLGSRAEVTLVVTMVMSFEWAPAPPAHLSHPGALHIKKELLFSPPHSAHGLRPCRQAQSQRGGTISSLRLNSCLLSKLS